jgi:hypothetical protein
MSDEIVRLIVAFCLGFACGAMLCSVMWTWMLVHLRKRSDRAEANPYGVGSKQL